MKKVLHLSHHYGCLKDHQYICNELGLDLTSNFSVWDTILPKGVFKITKKVANDIWNNNEDLFKSFDYITTSDTAPLSRIVLENIKSLMVFLISGFVIGLTIIWRPIQNIQTLLESIQDHPQVNLIPYSEFERFWGPIEKTSQQSKKRLDRSDLLFKLRLLKMKITSLDLMETISLKKHQAMF